MALLFMDGFDHYITADIAKKWTTLSNTTIVGGVGRRDGSAMSIASLNSVSKVFASAYSTLVLGFAFKRTANAANDMSITLRDSAIDHLVIKVIGASYLLGVYRGGTLLATGATAMALNTWYYIEFKGNIHNSTGSYTLKVNGVTELTASGIDTQNAGNASANTIVIATASSGVPGYFDDLYLCDTSGSTNNDFLGDVRVDTIYPSSDGNYQAFTPSAGSAHWSLVNDGSPDTATYVSSSNSGDRDTYGFTNLTPVTGTIMGVQVCNAALKDDAGARSVANIVRSGSTDATSATVALSTSQLFNLSIQETDPNTSAAWTESGVNAAEFGTKVAA